MPISYICEFSTIREQQASNYTLVVEQLHLLMEQHLLFQIIKSSTYQEKKETHWCCMTATPTAVTTRPRAMCIGNVRYNADQTVRLGS